MTMADNICECCNKEKELVGVASIPAMAMSIAWCKDCLEAGVMPYWAAVTNTAICGGYDHCNEWWKEDVNTTLKYFGKSIDEFKLDVNKEIENINKELDKLNKELK